MNHPCILTYHTFSKATGFKKHLPFLQKKSALVTVDDGDMSFYEIAYPFLKAYQIPVILFIIPSLIGTDQPFWWNEVLYYEGEEQGQQTLRKLKQVPNQERIAYLNKLRSESILAPLRQKQLTIDQLLEMQQNGIIIGNHSYSHPMFDQCDQEELENEMVQSKAFFETHSLKGFGYFAYPNGNYNTLAEKVLIKYGVKQAFLFDHQLNQYNTNTLRTSRLSVNDDTPLWKLRLICSGWHSKVLPMRQSLYKFLGR